jgi:predicted PurR-regulated permease PerM
MLLTPLVDRLEATALFRARRGAAVVTLNLAFVAILAGVIALLAPTTARQVSAFADDIPKYIHQLQGTIDGAAGALSLRGIDVSSAMPRGVGAVDSKLLTSALGVFAGTIGALINLLLVIVIAIYFQIQGRELIAAMRKLSPDHESFFDFTLVAAGSTLAAYIRGQLLMATIIGVYTGIAFTLLGVRYAVVIGVAAFFLEFLPLVGAPVAMLLGVLIALTQSPVLAVEALVAGLVGHALEAYIIGPRITGHATKVHPLAAMAALLIGAELGGILGALFAVPVAGMLNVYLGAMYRARRGEAAFALPESSETPLEDLPRLGDEIAAIAEPGEELETDSVPKAAAPKKRTRTKPAY